MQQFFQVPPFQQTIHIPVPLYASPLQTMVSIPPIMQQPSFVLSSQLWAPVPQRESIYSTLDLAHLHQNYPWTKKVILSNDDKELLHQAALEWPFISDSHWHTRAYNLSRNFKGIQLPHYLQHFAAINSQCEICQVTIYPVKYYDVNGGTEKLTVGNLDHTCTEVNGQFYDYTRGILCQTCNTNLGQLGDTCQKILDTCYHYISYVNKAEQSFWWNAPDINKPLLGKRCTYYHGSPGKNNYNSLKPNNDKWQDRDQTKEYRNGRGVIDVPSPYSK